MKMRKKLEDLSNRDVKRLQEDIEILKRRQKTFLVLAIICLVLFAVGVAGSVLLIVAIVNEIKNNSQSAAYFLFIIFDSLVGVITALLLIGGIALLVIRGTVFGKKIRSRQRIIEDYEDLHNQEQKE